MAGVKLELQYESGFPLVRVEGELNVANFSAMHLVLKGASKLGHVPVIADFTGDLTISDELKTLKCTGLRTEIPEWTTKVVLVAVSPPERLEEIEALLLPHHVLRASSIQEAIKIVGKTMPEAL